MQRLANWQLFTLCVLIWGTTWFAITFQVGQMAPEVSVAARFVLAGIVVLALCVVHRQPLRFSLARHLRLALQGSLMFGVSYICVYRAEQHVVSGLVAVGYSGSPLVAGLGAWWLFGLRVTRRFLFGGVLGLTGIAVIFWPEFGHAANGHETFIGLAFLVTAVLLSTVGSLSASRNSSRGMPFWPSLGFAMLYGAATCALVALVLGRSFVLPASLSWWLSLLYLALAGSVLTFACFLTLQDRIGPGPTGSIGVMTPLIALLVSMAFEDFRPDAFTFSGAALAVSGNLLMLGRRQAVA